MGLTREQAERMTFDEYRAVYKSLTFEDLKLLHKIWSERYPIQRYWVRTFGFYMDCIEYVIKDLKRKKLKIVELGGYDGELASFVLKKYPRLSWLNIEIQKHDATPSLMNYDYYEHVLSKQVWEENINLTEYDIFLSTSTLEHFTNEEFVKILNYLVSNKIKYLVLKIPIAPNGQTWEGARSSHLLTMGSNQMKRLLNKSYTMVVEKFKSWRSFWKLKP